MRLTPSLLTLLVLAAPAGAFQRDDLVANKYLPPEVGEIAPPIGNVHWLQPGEGESGQPTEILGLRGQVVIVQSYGHYCDP